MKIPSIIRKLINEIRFIKNLLISDIKRNNLKFQKSESYEISKLRKDGILVIKSIMDVQKCKKNLQLLEHFISKFKTSTKFKSGTFISFRTETSNDNADFGMIDIFNVDYEIPEIEFKEVIPIVEELTSRAYKKKVRFYRLNAYINEGVNYTRDYHIDNFSTDFKAFVYLTDVIDTTYGPYSYIKGSLGIYIPKYLNMIFNFFSKKRRAPDMTMFINKSRILNCIGNAGDLIISDQAGFHRGLPQVKDKKRVALVFNFKIQ